MGRGLISILVLLSTLTAFCYLPGAMAGPTDEGADLEIVHVDFSTSHLMKGKMTSVELLVRNNGPSDCEQVTITFHDGDELVGVVVIDRFAAGTDRTVVFSWSPAEGGAHRLTFKIDPENIIYETNEVDNIKVDKVSIGQSSGGLGNPGDVYLLAACGGYILLGMMSAWGLLVWRRKKLED